MLLNLNNVHGEFRNIKCNPKGSHICMYECGRSESRVPTSCIDDNGSSVSHGTSNDFSLDSIQIGPRIC